MMPRLTRVLPVLPAIVLLAVSGCGEAQTSDDPPKIGFVEQNTSRDFSKEMSEGFRAGAAIAGGVTAETAGPATHDGLKQVELFRELATRAKGGIGVSAVAPELIARPMGDVVASGVPVIAVAGGQIAPGAGAKLLIENDNFELGRMLADAVADRLAAGSAGKIVIGSNSPAQPALDQRAAGMRARLAERFPELQVTGPLDTQRDGPANLVTWRRVVDANPDALAFLGTGDIDAFNLAAVHAERKATWLAAAFSIDPKALQGIKDGHLVATVSAEHFLKGAVAGWLLAEHAKNGRALPEGWFQAPGLVITSGNVDEIIRRQATEASRLDAARPQVDKLTSDSKSYLKPLDQAR